MEYQGGRVVSSTEKISLSESCHPDPRIEQLEEDKNDESGSLNPGRI